jgi:hypothetical protein
MLNYIFFNNSKFVRVSVHGESDLQRFYKCCRCGRATYAKSSDWNYEYGLATYTWYQNENNEYLCRLCVDKVISPNRKCRHCDEQFTTGKEIIGHLITKHPDD